MCGTEVTQTLFFCHYSACKIEEVVMFTEYALNAYGA